MNLLSQHQPNCPSAQHLTNDHPRIPSTIGSDGSTCSIIKADIKTVRTSYQISNSPSTAYVGCASRSNVNTIITLYTITNSTVYKSISYYTKVPL